MAVVVVVVVLVHRHRRGAVVAEVVVVVVKVARVRQDAVDVVLFFGRLVVKILDVVVERVNQKTW